mmetsp:Transcript_58/g.71  ORF Transcript_58/g.71 Transcript_58/m.71 type:complete len:202 (-) Transcript_58:101-706(-)
MASIIAGLTYLQATRILSPSANERKNRKFESFSVDLTTKGGGIFESKPLPQPLHAQTREDVIAIPTGFLPHYDYVEVKGNPTLLELIQNFSALIGADRLSVSAGYIVLNSLRIEPILYPYPRKPPRALYSRDVLRDAKEESMRISQLYTERMKISGPLPGYIIVNCSASIDLDSLPAWLQTWIPKNTEVRTPCLKVLMPRS